MPRLPEAREGTRVKVKGRPLEFSYWPMYKGTRRYGLQAHVYATNPWALISAAIKERCSPASKPEALATLEQAQYFYRAAEEAQSWAAKPLLLYYGFMNLGKAYGLTERTRPTFDQAHHGLSERRRTGGTDLSDAYLKAFPSQGRNGANLFSCFLEATAGFGLAQAVELDVAKILPQLVAGHRLWCDAAGRKERFVAVKDILFMQNEDNDTLWLEFRLFAGDLSRLNLTRKRLLDGSDLTHLIREVKSELRQADRRILRFEQRTPWSYGHRVSDVIPDLVDMFQNALWGTALSIPPFRKYYLYVCPKKEQSHRLPQLAGIYAVMYYLGSITRYRPQQFDELVSGPFGGHLQEVLSSQPAQFLYLMASEFARRDVTHPALV